MPFASTGVSRIRTNIAAENAYNSLDLASRDISLRQLRLSTGNRLNSAADDVAGYITSRALKARNSSLNSCLLAVGDAQNVCHITMDALSNIDDLTRLIKDAAAQASSGSVGTAEKVALAKAAYRMAQQIQTVADSTVFGKRQLLNTSYTANFIIGFDATNTLLTLVIDMRKENPDFNVRSLNFNVNAVPSESTHMRNTAPNTYFAGITNLNLEDLNKINENNLGIFSDEEIGYTLTSLAHAISNINKTASYLGGIANRLTSQEDLLKSQITNYDAAVSRIADADVAKEQLKLIKSQFLQQASITSLSQANQNPVSFLKLLG